MLKVNSTSSRTPYTPAGPVARPDGSGQPAQAGRAAAGSAQVALSPTSLKLAALQDGASDIDLARVAELREAIAAGRLPIDASRIADGLIASARELLK